MKLSIPDAAKIVYEARRSAPPEEGVSPVELLPFEELTSEDREPLLAEIQAVKQDGASMNDALGQAIVDALR